MENDMRIVGVLIADQFGSVVVVDDQIVVVDTLVVPLVFVLLQTEALIVIAFLHKQLLVMRNAIQFFCGNREVI